MKLYVARHGETVWNAEDRVLGSTDLPLNETGLAQAAALAGAMRDKQLGQIVASPLQRARQTAEAVAEATGAPLAIDPRLREQCFGDYEGVSRKDPVFLEQKMQFAVRMPGGGESLFDVAHRVYNALDDLKAAQPAENILIVAHGSVFRVIHSYFADLPNAQYAVTLIGNTEWRGYEL